MLTQLSATYLASFDHALNVAEQVDLPGATVIEPSCFTGIQFAHLKDATFFVLRFDAELREIHGRPGFLAVTRETPGAVHAWLQANPATCQLNEMVAVQFCSASDKERFEAAL